MQLEKPCYLHYDTVLLPNTWWPALTMSNIVTFYPVFPIPKENLIVYFAKSSEDKGEVPPQLIAVQKQPARPLSTLPVPSALSPPGLHAIGYLHSPSNRVWAVPGTLQLLSKMSPACVLFTASHPSSSTHFQWMPFCQDPPFLVVVVTHVTRIFPSWYLCQHAVMT